MGRDSYSKLRFSACLSLAFFGCDSAHLGNGFYPTVQIGSGDTMKPSGERSLTPPPLLSYIEYMRGSNLAMATHLLRGEQSDPVHVAFYLEGSLGTDKLDRTVKTTQLLHSDFGNVSLMKTCFYNRSFETNLNTLAIGRYDGEAEPAEQVAAPPAMKETPSSFALLRVYRDGEGRAVLTGNYEPNGTLRSLHLDHTRDGVRLHYPEDGTWIDPIPPKTLQVPVPVGIGLPPMLKPPLGQPLSLPTAPLPVVLDVCLLPTLMEP